MVTGLLISRSSTGENLQHILSERSHLPTFFLPVYFVQRNKFSAYISIHCGWYLRQARQYVELLGFTCVGVKNPRVLLEEWWI
jgi:hypothetical protein